MKAVSPVGTPSHCRTSGATMVMPKKPRTTDGMPARTSISGFRISRAQFGRHLAHEHGRGHAQRQGDHDRHEGHQHRAEDERQGAELPERRVPQVAQQARRPAA